MMDLSKQIKSVFLAVLIGLAALFLASSLASMQGGAISASNIQYPVSELGNCKNEVDCRSYCDKPGNIEACIDFAQKHNLMPQEELEMAKKFIAAGQEGPGGCTSKESCETYCNDASHIEECIDFGEENGLIPPDELEEAKKVRDALRKGAQLPGGCKNKKECNVYCAAPEHMEECIAFAEAAGFIPPEELADARKALEAIKKGVKPLPCRGKTECDAYCAEPGNFETCIAFAEAAGFVSSEEAAMARKTGGKGPGNCRGKEECEIFCQNQDNQETCLNFGKEHGLIPEEDLREMEEGKQKMKEGLLNAPPQVLECLTNAFGSEFIEKLKTGTAIPSRDMGDKMRDCFESMGPPGGMPPGEGMPGGGPPDGRMPPEGGVMPPGFGGPGGCKTPEECRKYCEANPEECNRPVPLQGQDRGGEMMKPLEGFRPPEGFPPSGRSPEGGQSPEGFRPPERFQIPEGFQPPTGEFQPPSGTFTPPPSGEFMPPPTMMTPPAEFVPPPSGETAPPQTLLQYSPFGVILKFFLGY